MKLVVIVNAIINAGDRVASVLSDGGGSGGDALQKSMDVLKSVLLPDLEVEKDSKAERAKAVLSREAAKGEIRFKVVGGDKKRPGSVRLKKKDK